MKNLLAFVTVTVFFIVLAGHIPAEGFDKEPIEPAMLLAQQADESSDKQSEAARDEVSEETEAEGEDEYDDDDEYADEEDVQLIPDPFFEMNTAFYHFNDSAV